MRGRGSAWLTMGVVAICLSGAATLQAVRDRRYASAPSSEWLYLRSGKALDRMALSFDALVADVYWIRAVQYFGRTRLSTDPKKNYNLLYPLLDITTSLDPQFNIAYRFGAIFLAEGYPSGPGQPGQAVRLLEKGYRANPARWEYVLDTAFVYYWWLRDYQAASIWFNKAADVPGSPEWLRPVAAVTLAQGGNREGSRFLWQQIYDTADHEYLKKAAAHRLMQLQAMDQIDELNALVARHASVTGRPVQGWTPLLAAGWLRRVPTDPGGTPYVIDPRTGKATVSDRSAYYPLPAETTSDSPPAGSSP
jgi:hypothetical protein